MKKDFVTLKVNLLCGKTFGIIIKRSYAEFLMKDFHSRIFKRGSFKLGNFDMKERVQVLNIKYITSMLIDEEGE
jgi:hypothetical protein